MEKQVEDIIEEQVDESHEKQVPEQEEDDNQVHGEKNPNIGSSK